MKKQSTSVTGTNLLHAKNHNRRAILDAVRRHDGLSRADITRLTNLSAQTISNLVGELEEAGLLLAGEPVRQKRGQPARPYRLNPDGGYAIGFQLTGTQIDAVLVDLMGEERCQLSRPVNHPDPMQAVDLLVAASHDIIAKSQLDPARNIGIGVAMPGPVGIAGPTGIAPGWEGFDLAGIMSEKAGCPVFVENDADAAAVSEKLYGTARELDNFVYIFIGHGLGAGLFLDGRIIHGAKGGAGEIGHIPIEANGRPCDCGRKGCLERYVSLLALYEEFDTAHRDDLINDQSLTHIAALSPDDGPVRNWINQAAPHLNTTLQIISSMLNPQAVILGGLLPDPILRALWKEVIRLQNTSGPTPTGDTLPILISDGNTYSAARGAAALPIYQEMIPDFQNMLKVRDNA
ncbi:ROK family protein [Thalassospira alkalitolerans]|uniref:ROK family transcriptional regulator n=1 Tax=Thalassospira alkalitolerans TaxID=1293890 RepID=UPI003AA937E1